MAGVATLLLVAITHAPIENGSPTTPNARPRHLHSRGHAAQTTSPTSPTRQVDPVFCRNRNAFGRRSTFPNAPEARRCFALREQRPDQRSRQEAAAALRADGICI
jgi:hypothetical protein